MYAHNTDLSTGGGSSWTEFRMNSIFDPEFAFGGTQPLGHDQWEVFFDRYKVMMVKVAYDVTSTGGFPFIFQHRSYPSGQSNPTAYVESIEEPRTKTYQFGAKDGARTTRRITVMYRPWKTLAIRFNQYRDNDLYGALFGTNPGLGVMFAHRIHALGGSCSANVTTRISFYCQLSEPKVVPVSV